MTELYEKIEALAAEAEESSYGDVAEHLRQVAARVTPPSSDETFWARAGRAVHKYLVMEFYRQPDPDCSTSHGTDGKPEAFTAYVTIPLEGVSVREWVERWDPGDPHDRYCATCRAQPGIRCTGNVPNGLPWHSVRRNGPKGVPGQRS